MLVLLYQCDTNYDVSQIFLMGDHSYLENDNFTENEKYNKLVKKAEVFCVAMVKYGFNIEADWLVKIFKSHM